MLNRFFRNILLVCLILISGNVIADENNKNDYYSFTPSQFSTNNQIVIEPWNSAAGVKMLESSTYKNDFYQLASFFQPQINPLYCGIASSVIVLNAVHSHDNGFTSQKELEVTLANNNPIPFRTYSQLTFLNAETDKIKDRLIIELKNPYDPHDKIDPGLSLNQLYMILTKNYNLDVKLNYVSKNDQKSISDFRTLVKKIFSDEDNFIIANFNGKTIGLKSGGHISPLAAYDEDNDSILVLDVAGHKNPWYWVKLEHLYKAMNTKDGNKYRGYLIIHSDVTKQPAN